MKLFHITEATLYEFPRHYIVQADSEEEAVNKFKAIYKSVIIADIKEIEDDVAVKVKECSKNGVNLIIFPTVYKRL